MFRKHRPRETQVADRTGTQHRLCLSISHSPTVEIDRGLRIAGEAGFPCVELWASDLEAYLARHPLVWLDLQMREHGIHSLVVNGIQAPTVSLGTAGGDALINQARFLEFCTHLDALGGGTIILRPAAEREDKEMGLEEIVRALRAHVDMATPFEVTLALEFQAKSVVPDLATAQAIVERIARANLRLAISTQEWCTSEIDPRTLDALKPELLVLVHLDDLTERLPQAAGPSQSPVHGGPGYAEGLCARLAAVGFRGPYSIPLPPGSGTPLGRARTARQAALDRLASLYTEQ